jgi:predicted Rossmann-fold nucleotide-binding protein
MEIDRMTETPAKSVLVTGTGWTSPAKRRVARMLGTTLAEAGFGMVTGNSTGVDQWASDAFCAARAERGEPVPGAFIQIALGGVHVLRRGGLPLPGYAAPPACKVPADSVEAWRREALARSDAAVMVGGGRGALDIARRFIERGRPVFPLPFLGGIAGHSDFVFQEILKTWDGHPVPGLSRTQFLRLAEPWVSGTGTLANLLLGTLAETPDVFVSYRRSDAPAAAGRLAHDLAEHFGQRRVFLDIQGIAPSRAWDQSIEGALQQCKVGVIVIGRQWLAPGRDGQTSRLHEKDDEVRKEIAELLRLKKAIFPVLVEGARLPEALDLPDPLVPLLRFQATAIDNGSWAVTMNLLIREMQAVIQGADVPRRPASPSVVSADARPSDAAIPQPRIPDEPRLGALELRTPSVSQHAVGAGPRRRDG